MLGVALAGRRQDAVIASKFGLHVGEEQTVFNGAAITAAIDETLAALQTDYIDLMQIHCAPRAAWRPPGGCRG